MRKSQILRGRTSFDRVFRTGRRVEGNLFRFYLLLQASRRPTVHVGFAVSARSLPAVRRNRVRRMMREAFRSEEAPLQDSLSRARTSLEGVLVYRPKQRVESRRLALSDVRDDVARILRLVRERL